MPLRVSLNTLKLLSSFVNTKETIQPILELPPQKPMINDFDESTLLERGNPLDAGFPEGYIESYFNEIENDDSIYPHQLMVIKDGKVIGEKIYEPYDKKTWNACFSLTKTTIGLAIGFLYDEGKINLDEKYYHILAPKKPINIYQKDLSIRHLLTMTTGVRFNESSSAVSKEWIKDYMSATVKFKAGSKFEYNSLNTYILSAIVTKIAGESVTSFLKRKLYDPLGIKDFYYEVSPEGIEKGGWGLYLTTEDMAKLGLLILNNGKWNGRELISEDWIKQMSSTEMKVGMAGQKFDYGFQMWTKEKTGLCCYNGLFDQDIIIYRNTGVVLVSACGNNDAFHSNNIFRIHEKYFAKVPNRYFRCKPLIKNVKKESDPSLFHYYSRLNNNYFKAVEKNTASVSVLPFVLQVVMNTYTSGFSGFSFKKEKGDYILHIDQVNEDINLHYNFDKGVRQTLSFYKNKYECVVKGRFTRNEEDAPLLLISIYFLEFASVRYIKIFFTKDGKSLRVQLSENPGKFFVYNLLSFADEKTEKLLKSMANIIDTNILISKMNEIIQPDFTAVRCKTETLLEDEKEFLGFKEEDN